MNPPTDPLSPTPLSEAVETLRPWGLRHHENCPVWWRTGQPKSCSCGLDAALGEAPKPTVEDLEAYIDLALIEWDANTAGTKALSGYIARSIHHRLSPGVAEPPTPCRHSIYHSGCSSCDESDPESRPGHPWADRRAVDLGEKP